MSDFCVDCEYFELHWYPDTVEISVDGLDYERVKGACHRRAPRLSGRFPSVVGSDWCGEFRARNLVPGKKPLEGN